MTLPASSRRHYAALPRAARPQRIVLLDTLADMDGDIGTWRDALRGLDRAGMHGIGGGFPAWLMQERT